MACVAICKGVVKTRSGPRRGLARRVRRRTGLVRPVTGERDRMKLTTIFTWGYYGWGNATPSLVEAVDAVEASRGFEPPIFVDIRIRRTVRAEGFRGSNFEKLLGPSRHRWMKGLGNKFILTRTGPIVQIADRSAADDLLDLALESATHERRLLFFCSCQWPKFDGELACHRTTVAELVLKAARRLSAAIEIVEWPDGARHSETQEELVVYHQDYGDRALWVRPKLMFLEGVEVDGRSVPRFEFVGKE
jgi:Protein of unknown function (DUF1653)